MLKSCQTTIEWHEAAGEIPPFFVSFGQDVGERGMTRREFIGAGLGITASAAIASPIRSTLGSLERIEAGVGLPYDSEVEYIFSTGFQWIDTEYAFRDDFAWEITFEGIAIGTTLFGGRTSSVRTAILYRRNVDTYNVTCPIGNLHGTSTPFQLSDLSKGVHKVKMAVKQNHGSIWVDDSIIYNNLYFSGEYVSGVPQALFADNFGNGNITEHTSSKVYRLTMWQQDMIVRDLIPVRVTYSNGEMDGAMFDRVTECLFLNKGTRPFLVGPDI